MARKLCVLIVFLFLIVGPYPRRKHEASCRTAAKAMGARILKNNFSIGSRLGLLSRPELQLDQRLAAV